MSTLPLKPRQPIEGRSPSGPVEGFAARSEAQPAAAPEAARHDYVFQWLDLIWLALVAFLALLNPIFEIHKQLTLIAIGLFQIFDRRMLASIPVRRRNAYIVIIKILLATLLVGHTDVVPLRSPYWLVYFVPVVSAAMFYEVWGTLLWTAIASACYCSYLYPALKEYELTPAGATELAIRILFLFLAAVIVNRFVIENRRQAESYRKLAETLAETNVRLEKAQAEVRRSERLAALGQLTAGVAHEIRNPLGVIKTSAEMLAKKLPAEEGLPRELAGYILTEVDRLNGIVSRFLDFARPMAVDRKPEDVTAVLERSVKAFEDGHPNSSVKFERHYEPALPLISLDAQLCEQVFVNLAINAYQAMGEAGGLIRISARSAMIDGRPGVEIDFEDDGPGVPAELREQVFNPFFTTKRDGVGLGLSIVSKIIDEHGGSIRLQGAPGRGARFRIFLPRN